MGCIYPILGARVLLLLCGFGLLLVFVGRVGCFAVRGFA